MFISDILGLHERDYFFLRDCTNMGKHGSLSTKALSRCQALLFNNNLLEFERSTRTLRHENCVNLDGGPAIRRHLRGRPLAASRLQSR